MAEARKFRHEDVARKPRGWRVRTVTHPSGHRIRLAFPRGPRRHGAGRLVSILHPRSENPKACPAQNPNWLVKAQELFKKFHGKSPKRVTNLEDPGVSKPGAYTTLGDLVDLTVRQPNGEEDKLIFKRDGVKLASSPDGKQLYFIGGNQAFDWNGDKELVDLGEAVQITYLARKSISHLKPIEWVHDFGEESGVRPRLFYNRSTQRLLLAGGNYRVEAPGIID